MEKLKAAGVGVECRGRLVLSGWCKQRSVEVNVEKCGVMHMRRRGVKRTGEKFYVDSKKIEVVEEYKYLGCD